MESVVENLRTAEVPRLRCGVGPTEGDLPGEALVDFVLSPFQREEKEAVEGMIERAADACEAWLDQQAASLPLGYVIESESCSRYCSDPKVNPLY